jgi:uncharacterized SAM-binding protein YcdF (DUF218 family)
MRVLRFLMLLVVLVALGYIAVLAVVFQSARTQSGDETHFDTLIVLGTPTKEDGTPSLEMRERVDEAVREFRAGVAPHVIMTGAAAHNSFVEAQAMADDAVGQGVPRAAIVVEDHAKDTIQNIWFSRAIMQANGWHSAEVISSPYHLPRTSLILRHYHGALGFDWRTHAAHWPPEYGIAKKLSKDYYEAFGLTKLTLHGFPTSARYLPR